MNFRGKTLVLLILPTVVLAACAESSQGQSASPLDSQSQPLPPSLPQSQPAVQQSEYSEEPSAEDLARWDKQGAVEVEIRPRNFLSAVGGLLEFDVFMNTHSVDLSMDLATVATLETDLGLYVSAGWWSGGGGHHVQGVLTFPEKDTAGRMILDGAQTITLRIEGVDAPVREFQWEAPPES
jgi:hypothetical protein